MTDSSTNRRQRIVNAVIVIADIENSSQIAETSSASVYNGMIREYHRMASRAVDEYSRTIRSLEEAILYRRAVGDEVIIILNSRNIIQSVTYALNLAVLLEVEWARSRFNVNRLREDRSPCRLRVGIGKGHVTLAESVWKQGITPEGYAIAQTKRIESNAGADINEPHILISGTLKPVVEKIEGIEIGASEVVHPVKTIGTKAFEAVRIKSYEKLYHEYRQRIRIADRYIKWHSRGIQAYSAGDYQDAYHCFMLAAKYKPQGVLNLVNLGGIALFMGKLDEAETTIRKVLTIKRDCHQALNTLGSVLEKQGRYTEAEQALQRAIRIEPDYPLAHYNLGNISFLLNKPDQTEQAYRQAIKLKPDYIAAYCNLATLRLNQDRIDEAIRLARRALEINPHNKITRELTDRLEALKKGEDLVSQNRLDLAVEHYQSMIITYPKYPLVHFNLARVLNKLGRNREAEEEYKKALELNPDYRMALMHYAELKRDQGNIAEALSLARRAHEVNPDSEDTNRLLKQLETSAGKPL